jgi:pimeloyl-ACP methyl ester carboxylesterase
MQTLRVLCLHGYHGSADILRQQMEPLVSGLDSADLDSAPPNSALLDWDLEFIYVDAPSLAAGDFGWWHHNFRGWERTRDWAVDFFSRHEHFDGVFGFSQGAALTSLLVGLRAPDGRVTEQRPLTFEFAMMVGGFRSDSPIHADLYARQENFLLPSLHIIGDSDRVVPAADSRVLARQFVSPVVLAHSGGHVVPGTAPIRREVARFLGEMAERRKAGTSAA